MKLKAHFSILAIAVIMALVAGAMGPHSVYADDGGSTDGSGGEAPVSETTDGDTSDEETPISETTEEESAPEEETSVAEEPVFIPEVLEQAPEGSELAVVNDAGEVVPLVMEEAAEIIATGDPMWCPDGAAPGDAGCTGSFGTFDELIDALETDALSGSPVYTGNGVIWVEDSYNGNDNAQVEFDNSALTNIGGSNLTIQGGWSGGNDTNVTGISDLDVSLVFVNWGGNITLNDLAIAAEDGSGFGLLVGTSGDVTMDNVSVSDTTVNSFGYGDGALVAADGNVDVTDSAFDDNAGNGLQVLSGGNVTLDTVSASGNALTGAYLDTCGYDNATGLCDGNGLVTITSPTGNTFNGNGYIGVTVDSGGGVAMDNTQVNNNSLDGAVITSADNNGTGNVSIDQSDFSGNSNAYGLDVLTDGNINLTDVTANSNGFGAVLDTTAGSGSVSVSDSTFGDSALTGNTWSGLHIESGGAATLLNVIASYNGTNGAYIEAQGDIDVTNSVFNGNVHFNFPHDPGLYASSNGGNITLLDVIADGNVFGAGVVLLTDGSGIIHVSESALGASHFNDNGTFGVQAVSGNGDITLADIEASYNDSKGAYLKSYGQGNIFVTDSLFVENGNYGVYAAANQGDVTLDTVTVTGDDGVAASANDDLTNTGAFLASYGGGNIFVTDSVFELNTGVGLMVVGSNLVELVNVTADHNGGNGVEVYSTYTDGCIRPGEAVVNVTVNVDGGNFTNNGEYGVMAMPGPAGTLVFVNPSTFGGNGLGDYLLDSSVPEICPEKPEKPETPDNPNIVPVPTPGNLPVEQDCENFTSTILELPDGTWVNVGCPYEGFSNLNGLEFDDLPGSLGAGTVFVNGVVVSLTDAEGNTILNQNGFVTVNFVLPENARGRTHSVLFWDPTLNDGQGGWMKLPVFEAGTSFPLHPENPDDPRIVISGVQQQDNLITFTVNFSGVFVLTTP